MTLAQDIHAAFKLLEAGHFRASEQAFRVVLDRHPALPEARYGWIGARMAQATWSAADGSIADVLDRIVASDSLSYPPVLITAAREYGKARRLDLAAAALRKALVSLGRQFPILLQLARCELAVGNDAAAESLAREALGLNASVDADFILGCALARQGKLTDARDCLRGVLEAAPTYPRAMSRLAAVLDALGETEDAARLAADAAAAAPADAAAHFVTARICARRGDNDAAERALIALSRANDFITCETELVAGRTTWREDAIDQRRILRAFAPLYGEVAARQGWLEQALAESNVPDDVSRETHRPETRTAPGAGSRGAYVTLVTCGSAAFRIQQERQAESALAVGEIDEALLWTRADIEATQFYRNHPTLLGRPRGSGYWVWKPYVILRALSARPDGDYVVYYDCGRGEGHRFTHSVRPLIAWCAQEKTGMLPGVGRSAFGPSLHWIKRDCFHLMGCDAPAYWNHPQVSATISVWRNSPEARGFVRTWLQYCLDPRIVSDHANVCGLPNHDGFLDHRHDQAVLTNLVVRHGLYVPDVGSSDINLLSTALRPPS